MLIRSTAHIINGLFKRARQEDELAYPTLAFGVSPLLQRAGEGQDLSAHLQDPAAPMDCLEAWEGQLLSHVPGALSQFAREGWRICPLGICMCFSSSPLFTAVFFYPSCFSIAMYTLTVDGFCSLDGFY